MLGQSSLGLACSLTEGCFESPLSPSHHHHQFTIIIIIVPFDAPIHTYLYPPDTTPLVIWLPAFHVVGHRLLLPFPLLATAAGDNVMMRCCCSYWLVLTMLLQPILTLYDSSIIANV